MRNLLFVCLAFGVFACGGGGSSAEQVMDSKVKDPARVNVKPTATPVSEKNQIEVPILNFAQFEPLLNQNNDTTYVINFWATWCAPCVRELPYFEELNDVYADEKVRVILVSLDFKRQITKKLLPFIEKHALESEVIVLVDPDANSWINKVSPDWSGAIPATMVYNASERKFYEQSFHSFQELNAIVKPLIKS